MAVIYERTYGIANTSALQGGIPVAKTGLRLVDYSDLVGPENTNRSLLSLLANDQEINLHVNEISRAYTDGVFPEVGESFLTVQSGVTNNTAMTFVVREGAGKIANQVFHNKYVPQTTTEDRVDQDGNYVAFPISPQITLVNIDVQNMTQNSFRRDLLVLNNAGQVLALPGAVQTFLPGEYSQIDAPADTIALNSILFQKVTGIVQTPVVNAVYDTVKIEGVDLIQRFAGLFGNGIFIGEPVSETDPTKKEFFPTVIGGNQIGAAAGSALIAGKLVVYGSAGNRITLSRATLQVGTDVVPGSIQGQNTNGWEFVDFTSTSSVGAAGVGNGNTQFLKFDNLGKTGFMDAGSIIIYTAAPVGEGGFTVQRPFDTNVFNIATTEEYSIDLTNGTIKREKTTAPLRVFIKYTFFRNRRYLPYIDQFGTLSALQSEDTFPALPAEFSLSQLPDNTIGLKSILSAATDTTLQPGNFGQDFRVYMNFVLENGQITTISIQDGAVTSSKIASGAINNASMFAPGVIVQQALSQELQNSLSSSLVIARHSLATKYSSFENIFSFADNSNAKGDTLTKQMTDTAGNNLIFTDAELQVPADRAVVFKDIFKSFVSTEVSTDPANSKQTVTINSSDIGNISGVTNIIVDAVSISFQDFGFSQVGNALVQLYDHLGNVVLATQQVPLATIRNSLLGQASQFYKFVFDVPAAVTIGQPFQIRIAKTIATDTCFVHTASDGAGKNNDLAHRTFYLPSAGKYGVIGGQIQGYRIFDDFGDITIENQNRVALGKPSFYIPYAGNISDISTFDVFTDVDSDEDNYVAVDLTRGIFKFTEGFEPTTARVYTDHNMNQGFANLSSERIHRPNGLTIESSLKILEEELGSVKANIRNHLERLYFLGGGKFRFSSEDRHLVDLGGVNLRLQDGNLLNPIHVIDNQYLVPEGRESSRVIQDSFNNTDVIEFTARFNNVAILAVNFAVAGTDYDAVQVVLMDGPFVANDFVNPPLATAAIAKSEIKADFNFFLLQANLTVGSKYHVYIKVINFLGGLAVRPKMKVDVENGMIEYQEYFIPLPGKYGTLNGYTLYDAFGDLNLGAEARGSSIDVDQSNFLDADGAQVQPFFDDNDSDPSLANTTFPIFSPTKPSTTGMVAFEIYFREVPGAGDDGFNGVFRLQLHDSTNEAIVPANALQGQDFLDVRVPKTVGWYKVSFIASLVFGESYHMHIWANGFDLDLYVGTHPTTNEKAFRYVAGDRFIPFAADLSGDNFETFDIVAQKLVAVDVTQGRIKFHPLDITAGNSYFADFNLFTKTADLQSDTIVRPDGRTIEESFLNTVPVRQSEPTRTGIDTYQFNARDIQLVDELGRDLNRSDAELTRPYERITIEDTSVGGTASSLTSIEDDNTYTFFVDHYEEVEIPSVVLNYDTVTKSSFNTILRIYRQGTTNVLKTAYIRSKDLVTGFNTIVLEDVSGNALNFFADPNVQYVFKMSADAVGPGTAPKVARNNNNIVTATINVKPVNNGLYGTFNGVIIEDDFGDIFRYNIDRDDKGTPVTGLNTDSGLVNLKIAQGSTRGIAVWQENSSVSAARFDRTTGLFIDTTKISIAGASGNPAIQPDVTVSDDIAFTVWVQSGQVYGRRVFLNNLSPLSPDTVPYQISVGASGVAWPTVAAGRDRFAVAWEDTRDTPSGSINLVQNDKNVFAFSFNNATTASQFVPTTNANYGVFRVNNSALTTTLFTRPDVSIYADRAVFVYQTDINNPGLSRDVYLAVYDMRSGNLLRSDIRVDKAPVVDDTTQIDSYQPKISSYRNHHAVAWLDNRNGDGAQVFGKVYDSAKLTFDQSDTLLDNLSGIIHHNIHVSEKIMTVSCVVGIAGLVKRIDFGSLTDHDSEPWSMNFDSVLTNKINEIYAVSNGKLIHSFGADTSGTAIIKSTVTGINIEPVTVDLTDVTRSVSPGYIGIDVVNNIYKFADGEEI